MTPVRIMPPRKRTVGVRAPDNPGDAHLAAPHEGISPDELTADTERVLAELGESASAVVLYRMKDGKPGEWDFVTRIPAAEFTPDYVKEQYGGGDYKVVIIDATQGALNPVLFSIDRRFVGKLWGNMAPAALQQTTGDPFRDKMMEILLAKALTPAPQQNTTKDTIELVLAVVAAMKGGDSGNVMEQVNAMLQTSMTLAQTMNPPEGLAGIAGSFLPVIERLVPQPRAARATLTAPKAPAAPPPANPNPPAMTTEVHSPAARVAGTIVPKWLTPFRMLAPMLVRYADRGSEPEVYAEMALDEMQDNEALFAAAVEAMNEGRLLTDLYAVAPDLSLTDERKAFATGLVGRIAEGLQEIINTPEDETETEPDGDTAANG